MKIKILTLVLVLLYSIANAGITQKLASVIAVKNTPFCIGTELLCEQFEGTGAPSGWSTLSGTPDYDYTTSPAPLAGSKSYKNAYQTQALSDEFTAQSDLYVGFQLNLTAVGNSAEMEIFSFRTTGGGTTGCYLTLDSSQQLYAHHDTTVLASSSSLSATTYYIWIHFVTENGTDADGVFNVRVGTTGVYANATEQIDMTNGVGSTNVAAFRLTYWGSDSGGLQIFDNIKVQTTAIGNM